MDAIFMARSFRWAGGCATKARAERATGRCRYRRGLSANSGRLTVFATAEMAAALRRFVAKNEGVRSPRARTRAGRTRVSLTRVRWTRRVFIAISMVLGAAETAARAGAAARRAAGRARVILGLAGVGGALGAVGGRASRLLPPRQRAGRRCAACGYDLAAVPVTSGAVGGVRAERPTCPECGRRQW